MPKEKVARNTTGKWTNSSLFCEEAENFTKNGYYCEYPTGSPAWKEYWLEQRKRIIEGYQIGGARITGSHYFYLNFCPILKVDEKKSAKVKGFPDFWDGDYNYFWIVDIARYGLSKALGYINNLTDAKLESKFNQLKLFVKIKTEHLKGGYNIIIGKARRRGYSYKSAAIVARNYFTKPDSYTMVAAYEKKFLFPKGLFTMVLNYINFINDNTPFSMPSDKINKQDHIRASYEENINGIKLEKGFKSEVQAVSFKDNADAGRGKDCDIVLFEESGAFGTIGLLKASYNATKPTVQAGMLSTGIIIIFGTSGDMESGSADYADMFYKPEAYDLLPFNNIWDDQMESTTCGFFHPISWNLEGYYDKNGNSDLKAATQAEIDRREKMINSGASSSEIQAHMQEFPLSPSEAFATISSNNFPVVELKNQLQKLRAHKWQEIRGLPVDLLYNGPKVEARPILDKSITPVTSIYNTPVDKSSCPIIYERPAQDAPRGLYKIGYDPIRQDQGTSLAAIIVYKAVLAESHSHSIIVAEYIGRRESPEDICRIAEQLADYYNTQIMYENEITSVKNYFRRIKRLNLLALQPDKVISKNIKKSKVSRVYGCHMTPQLKDAGERYIKDWLLTVLDHDEHGNKITVIDKIYSQRLLEELIAYNSKENFDLVSALIMCMFQVQEEELNKVHNTKDKAMTDTISRINKAMFKTFKR